MRSKPTTQEQMGCATSSASKSALRRIQQLFEPMEKQASARARLLYRTANLLCAQDQQYAASETDISESGLGHAVRVVLGVIHRYPRLTDEDPKKMVICLDYIVKSDTDDFTAHEIQSMRDIVEPDFQLRLIKNPADQDFLEEFGSS